MKKFSDYTNKQSPVETKRTLSLTEQAWANAKQKITERSDAYKPHEPIVEIIKEEIEEPEIVEILPEVAPIVEEVIEEEVNPEDVQRLIESLTGPQGERGEKGDKGDKGDTGEQGLKGEQGLPGIRGERGEDGPQGIKGDKGDKGDNGQNGKNGNAGPKGDTGDVGPKGDKGDRGEQGPEGKQGLTGAKGDKGDKGDVGPVGQKGADGAKGDKGDKGERGDKGDKGDVGEQGPKGEKGDQGPIGPKGADGKTPDIKKFAEKFDKLSQDINKRIDKTVQGMNLTGGGSGSYWLNDLGDTDHLGVKNATDGQVLTFDETLGKWTAADATGGGGTVDNIARTRATNAWNQANTGTLLAQAAYDYANTLPTSFTTDRLISGSNSAVLLANGSFQVPSHIIPSTSGIFSLGDENHKWADVWIGPNTLNIQDKLTGNNAQLTIEDSILFIDGAQVIKIGDMQMRTTGLTFPDGTYQNTASSNVDSWARSTANSATTLAQSAYDYANTITLSGISGDLQNVTNLGNTTTLGITTAAVQLNLTSAVTVSQGQMAWNPADLTVDVGMGNGVTLQLGQEQYIKVKASEAINDGDAVMFVGTSGEHILAAKCNTAVSGFRPDYFIGVATQNLTNNGFGYITVFGKVHDINTLAWQDGDILYADANVVGGLTTSMPTLPRPQITVATVTKRAGGDGHIFVRPTFEPTLAVSARLHAEAGYNQANTATLLAQSAYDYANTISVGSGPQGATGPQGVQGATGAQGVQGATGAQGVQGAVGAQGSAGTNGAQGAQGTQGAVGAQGATGTAGAQGVQGAQGSQGATGAQGATGTAGAQGSQGVQGATGPNYQNAFDQANLAFNAANTAVTTGQANVGAGLITITSAYQANVGAGLITEISSRQANVGAGLITITSAYQANVGAGVIAATSRAQSGWDAANVAYSTAMNAYGSASIAIIEAANAFNQANLAYDKANTAITTSGGTSQGTITSNSAIAFSAGFSANSGVALQMPFEGALRNSYNGVNTMYFDVSNGGSSHGYFNFRSSNTFTSLLHLGSTQATFGSGIAISAQTPYAGRTSYNVALDTVVTVDNIKYRVSNQGGIFPQIASASGSSVDVCYDVLGVVNGAGTTNAQNPGYILLANGTWLSIYSAHGMDARGDRLTAHITDKAVGRIYRATFMRTNNSSNVDGYNIIVERII